MRLFLFEGFEGDKHRNFRKFSFLLYGSCGICWNLESNETSHYAIRLFRSFLENKAKCKRFGCLRLLRFDRCSGIQNELEMYCVTSLFYEWVQYVPSARTTDVLPQRDRQRQQSDEMGECGLVRCEPVAHLLQQRRAHSTFCQPLECEHCWRRHVDESKNKSRTSQRTYLLDPW